LEVRGFAHRPAQAKPTGRKGYVFVRGRPIRDPFIVRAAEAGYRSTLAPDDRPSLILFLDLPGDAVDVNVHPSKLEVRFRDKFFVEKVVEEAVRAALGPLTAAAPLGTGGEPAGVGFQVSGFGGSGSPLEMFPRESLTPDTRFDGARCLQELVAELAGGRFGALANRLERFAATFACRAAIKAGQRLEAEEMRELVLRLLSATLPAHDVHGRPTIVQLPRG